MDLNDSENAPLVTAKKAGTKATHYKSSTLAAFFFTRDPTSTKKWICKNCKEPKTCDLKQGYSNLKNHLALCVGASYEDELTAFLIKTNQIIGIDGMPTRTLDANGFRRYSERQKDCYKWLKALILCNLPLTCCENENMRDLAGCNAGSSEPLTNTFCTKTIRKYILSLTSLVEQEIEKEMEGKLISVMFDGWEHRRRKFIGVFAGYEDDKTNQYDEVLLAIQPTLEADENGTAAAHVDLLESTLEIYNVDIDKNLVCLGADK